MNITSQHLTGFVVGVGAAAVGYYMYKKNQTQIDDFLRRQGIQMPESSAKDYDRLTLEELVTEKEHLEDLIAERELGEKQEVKASKK
jgi:hypothetical protein